jgi:hypothetical protein
MPTAEDIDDPAALVARLQATARGELPAQDAMDDALAQLLAEETDRTDGTPTPSEDDDGAPADDHPEDPRPV